jgi:VanZ family protein
MDSVRCRNRSFPGIGSLRDLAAHFVRYLELRLQLFGLSLETGLHLLVLVLLVTIVTCLVGFSR